MWFWWWPSEPGPGTVVRARLSSRLRKPRQAEGWPLAALFRWIQRGHTRPDAPGALERRRLASWRLAIEGATPPEMAGNTQGNNVMTAAPTVAFANVSTDAGRVVRVAGVHTAMGTDPLRAAREARKRSRYK
jgi:hypothetical protein